MVYQLKDLNVDPVHVKGIVCSCGGGGLYNGLVAGCHRNPLLKDVPMLVLETFQTASFDAAIKANEIVALPKIETLVTTLGSPYVATQTLANYKSHKTSMVFWLSLHVEQQWQRPHERKTSCRSLDRWELKM